MNLSKPYVYLGWSETLLKVPPSESAACVTLPHCASLLPKRVSREARAPVCDHHVGRFSGHFSSALPFSVVFDAAHQPVGHKRLRPSHGTMLPRPYQPVGVSVLAHPEPDRPFCHWGLLSAASLVGSLP